MINQLHEFKPPLPQGGPLDKRPCLKIDDIIHPPASSVQLSNYKVIYIERKILDNVDLEFLIEDTDDTNREMIYNTFNQMKEKICKRYNSEFKPYDFSKEEFTIYYLKVVNTKKITDFI